MYSAEIQCNNFDFAETVQGNRVQELPTSMQPEDCLQDPAGGPCSEADKCSSLPLKYCFFKVCFRPVINALVSVVVL